MLVFYSQCLSCFYLYYQLLGGKQELIGTLIIIIIRE